MHVMPKTKTNKIYAENSSQDPPKKTDKKQEYKLTVDQLKELVEAAFSAKKEDEVAATVLNLLDDRYGCMDGLADGLSADLVSGLSGANDSAGFKV